MVRPLFLMSLYSFFRTSALLVLAGKYRLKLFYMGAAIAFAFVTAWLYEDIANFLQAHNPQWLFLALVVKTLLVYGALFFVFWMLYIVPCTLYILPCTLYIVHCVLCLVPHALYLIPCALYFVSCVLCLVHKQCETYG